MKGKIFERCLVEAMIDAIERQGLKHKPVAISAWGDRKDPATKWRKIRNGTEPRGLQIQDAYDLAFAIGISFLDLCGSAQHKMQELNKLDNKVAPLKKEETQKKDSPQPTAFADRDENRTNIN